MFSIKAMLNTPKKKILAAGMFVLAGCGVATHLFLQNTRAVLALEEAVFGPYSLPVAKTLESLACKVPVKEGIALTRQALTIREYELEGDCLEIADNLERLAHRLTQDPNGMPEAQRHIKRALAIWKVRQGGNSLKYAQHLTDVREFCRDDGEYLKLNRQIVAIKEELLDVADPGLVCEQRFLALWYLKRGRNEEALAELKRMLKLEEKALGSNDPLVADTINDLGWFNQRLGRYADAEAAYLRSLAIRQQLGETEYIPILNNLDTLADFYFRQNRYVEAERYYKLSLDFRDRKEGINSIDSRSILRDYAKLCRKLNRNQEAEKMENRAEELEKRHRKIQHGHG